MFERVFDIRQDVLLHDEFSMKVIRHWLVIDENDWKQLESLLVENEMIEDWNCPTRESSEHVNDQLIPNEDAKENEEKSN